MIISCINCLKKFEVDSELIPSEGRTIQCGSCNHTWFFLKKNQEQKIDIDTELKKVSKTSSNTGYDNINENFLPNKNKKKMIRNNKVSSFTFSDFLSIILVLIISFIALLIVIDTFKSPLFNFFPNLELLIFNFFETLRDIQLFIIDLA